MHPLAGAKVHEWSWPEGPRFGGLLAFWVSLKGLSSAGVSALKSTLNKHVIGGARIERWIEI